MRSRIADGERPSMPRGRTDLGTTPEMWEMLAKCWEMEAAQRIVISGVLSFLQRT